MVTSLKQWHEVKVEVNEAEALMVEERIVETGIRAVQALNTLQLNNAYLGGSHLSHLA
jgi:hypothetical protein